jgi:vacuolar-type H+-ATPase subunit H
MESVPRIPDVPTMDNGEKCEVCPVNWTVPARPTFNYTNPWVTKKSLMSSAIEQTVKALVEFESALDRAKAEAAEAKKRAMKDAMDWAEAARSTAIAEATEIAARRVAGARADAEAEATEIREEATSKLKEFEGLISGHITAAADLAARRLLGESK